MSTLFIAFTEEADEFYEFMQNEGHHPFIGGIILIVGLYFFIISIKAMLDGWIMGEETGMPDIFKSVGVVVGFMLIIAGGGMISYLQPVVYVIIGLINLHNHMINRVFGDSTIIDVVINLSLFMLFIFSLHGVRLLFAIGRDHGPEYAGMAFRKLLFLSTICPFVFGLFSFLDNKDENIVLHFDSGTVHLTTYGVTVYLLIISILFTWSILPPYIYYNADTLENKG
jgi:hypothetical protein